MTSALLPPRFCTVAVDAIFSSAGVAGDTHLVATETTGNRCELFDVRTDECSTLLLCAATNDNVPVLRVPVLLTGVVTKDNCPATPDALLDMLPGVTKEIVAVAKGAVWLLWGCDGVAKVEAASLLIG